MDHLNFGASTDREEVEENDDDQYNDLHSKPFGIKIKHTKKEDKTYVNISKFMKTEDVKTATSSDLPGWNT